MYIVIPILAVILSAFGTYLLLNVLDVRLRFISTKKSFFSTKYKLMSLNCNP